MTKRLLSLFFLCALAGQGLLAQVTTSSLTGIIKTTANAPLAGATVTATNLPSGSVYSSTTTSKGQYNIQNMRVGGPYQVKITYVGYATQTFDDVYLRLAESFNLDATLSTGDQNLGTVVVTAGNRNSLLSATRNGTTTNISSRQILTLPTISRSINDLTRLTPQATSTNTGAIGGGNYRQNFITVDGSDFNNSFGIGNNLPAGGSPISLDALGEISINVTPYDIKQSGFIGSAINAVTRSGTNDFSGSAYTFWRNESMQGNKVGYNTPFTKQNLSVNTYGARLGGPIIKNKLFFFVNFETGKTISPGQTNVASTPSASYGTSG
ncbi:MAG: carboxypeptidase regulatory-like domain-containing protein, partial [Sphingobacteriaceae bacterium]